MSNKQPQKETPFDALKNESARQRWQLFHRAIAHAKQSNTAALAEADRLQQNDGTDTDGTLDPTRKESPLSLAR